MNRQWFKEHNACYDGYAWVCSQYKEDEEIDPEELISRLIAEARLNWANWTICRIFTDEQKIKYVIFAAEQALHLFEEKYPNDDRPRKAIEATKACLKSSTEENKQAAAEAAEAAWAAAWAARAAARVKMLKKILEYGLTLLKGGGE